MLENHGKRWTKCEDQQLISQYYDGNSYSEMAKYHRRTLEGIHARIVKLFMIEYDNVEELSKEYSIDIDTIQKYIHYNNTVTIYILQLECGKYYVGKTKNMDIRYRQHMNGNGSFWTKKYKPIKIEREIPNCSNFDEDRYVKEYMSRYGVDNVRGGAYIQEKLDSSTKRFIRNELLMANDMCLYCGEKDHFAKTCPYKIVYSNLLIYMYRSIINIFSKIKQVASSNVRN